MTTPKHPRDSYCDGLVALAEWLREHPEVPLPMYGRDLAFQVGVWSGAPREQMALIARAFPGKLEKTVDENYFDLEGEIAPGFRVMFTARRDQVCTRVVVDQHTVTETVPDPEFMADAPMVEVEKTVDVVRWECPPLLAELDDARV